MDYTFTINPEDAPVLEWALLKSQEAQIDVQDISGLLQLVLERDILAPWRVEYRRSTVVNTQAALEDSSDNVKLAAIEALAKLQNMTEEEQLAALDVLKKSPATRPVKKADAEAVEAEAEIPPKGKKA